MAQGSQDTRGRANARKGKLRLARLSLSRGFQNVMSGAGEVVHRVDSQSL